MTYLAGEGPQAQNASLKLPSLERVPQHHARRARKLPGGSVVVHALRGGTVDEGTRIVALVDVDRALTVGDVLLPELLAEIVRRVDRPVVRGREVELPEYRQPAVGALPVDRAGAGGRARRRR